MKRLIILPLIALLICGCAVKYRPEIVIKSDSVTSIDFKKTYFPEGEGSRTYSVKKLTEREDIDELSAWLESLRLVKQDAIEVPVEQVEYVIVLNGAKEHTAIFMNEYIIYDRTAYTFENETQRGAVSEKYNLLNYPEQQTQLDLMK